MYKEYFVKITNINKSGSESIAEIGPLEWNEVRELLDSMDRFVMTHRGARLIERQPKYRKIVFDSGNSCRILEAIDA
ncbi:MAG: hypothetical protein P8Z31_00040 [Gammaproteobacteria bacterium]